MMKLFYAKATCSLAIRIAIHEMNLPCEFVAVSLADKKTETGVDYMTINPKGSVPALLVNQDTLITEGTVIQQYLADTHHAYALLPKIGELSRYRVLEWLNFVATDLHKSCSPIFNPNVPQALKDTVFKDALKRPLNYLESHLKNNRYLTGEAVCLADFYAYVVLSWMPKLGLPLTEWPSVEWYFYRMHERKAVQLALKEEGLLENAEGGACSVR